MVGNNKYEQQRKKKRATTISPQDFLASKIESAGYDIEIRSSLEVKNFFEEYSPDQIAAYDADVLRAIRTQNIDQLQQYLTSGRPLMCSNQFGESLLHLACRRGFVDVVDFLVNVAGVSVKIIDDYGRTPLHDACWTCQPDFELLEIILTKCPDLLYMKDKRGHTPLSFVRKSQWQQYNAFLETSIDKFLGSRQQQKVF